MEKRVLHCWESGPWVQIGEDDDDVTSTTCVLAAGHEAPHEWTRDDRIVVSFEPAAPPAPEAK